MSNSPAVSEQPPAPVASRGMSLTKKILLWVGSIIVFLVLVGLYLFFFQLTSHTAPREKAKELAATGDAIMDSLRRGAEFLRIHQEDNGHFSRGLLDPKPAFTALTVDSLARSPEKYRMNTPFIKKAVDAILKTKQPDGSFCTPVLGLQTYCTAITVMALTSLEDPSLQADIDDGVKYLRTTQNQDEDSVNMGAAGYSAGGHSSGDVTHNWVEAMHSAGVKDTDPAMERAKTFFKRLQNSEDNPYAKNPPPGIQIGNDGGSGYSVGESKAGYDTTKDGKKIPKSYGLMSYASLKAFLHLNFKKTDQQVQDAHQWVQDNYTLDENKNIGQDGLFYYYLTMAKALYIYDDPIVESRDGKQQHHWAEELSKRLISLQAPDGSWHNSQSSQWFENDTVLVTGYAIRTLGICHDQLEREKHIEETK